jgi:ferric-dicitrate binding protein FerR (iron transport regulator)
MMSSYDRIAELIIKSWRSDITSEEEKQLEQWLASSPENRELYEHLSQGHDVNMLKNFEENNPDRNNHYFDKAGQQPPEPDNKGIPISKAACWVFAAASVAVCILLLLGRYLPDRAPYTALNENAVVLQLIDGTHILTDTIKNYLLIEQGRYQLLVHNNEIRYMPLTGQSFKKGQKGYNEIKIPARKMFTVILPDKSKVDLNALSSFRFPVTGAGGSIRNVELTGEGYFEVKPKYENNKKLPFVVKAKTAAGLSIDVTVKGTIFNINAYNESLINTTLLEGLVEVAANGEIISLAAGEQLQVGAIIRHNKITSDDIINTVSWKDGCFSFKNAPIMDVLKEVGSWYGVNIEVPDISRKNYTGRLFRSEALDSILTAIGDAINCKPKIEGDRARLIKN